MKNSLHILLFSISARSPNNNYTLKETQSNSPLTDLLHPDSVPPE
jgi:hypothetical protein